MARRHPPESDSKIIVLTFHPRKWIKITVPVIQRGAGTVPGASVHICNNVVE